MDPEILAGMIFSLIVLAMIGSFIILFPVVRRLGRALDVWLTERPDRSETAAELRRAREVVGHLADRVEALEERHAFLEELVSRRAALGAGDEEEGD